MFDVIQMLTILEIQGQIIDFDVVKASYRKLMLIWHPDKHQGQDRIRAATRRSQEINNAYEILTEYIETYGPISMKFGIKTGFTSERPRHEYSQQEFTPGFPDETVFEVFIKSSHIVSAGYNASSKKLYIKFDCGSVYEYLDVEKLVWNEFLEACPHGTYANKHIYRSYKYRKCTESNQIYNPKYVQ